MANDLGKLPGNNIDLDKIKNFELFTKSSQFTGSLERAVTHHMIGLDTYKSNSRLPRHKQGHPKVFFTRPCINLSDSNMSSTRQTIDYKTNNDSIQHAVRRILDPFLAERSPSPLVDNNMPFIVPLSNSCIKMSGWPDTILPTYSSKEGIRREQLIIADGVIDDYGGFDINAVFENIAGQPVKQIQALWLRGVSNEFENTFAPYNTMLANNEIDYYTRIIVLVMDYTNTFVNEIASCIAFPTNLARGEAFDVDKTKPINDSSEVTIRFKCFAAEYNDPILLNEFNQFVLMFNDDMFAMWKKEKNHNMEKIPKQFLHIFSNWAYPFINLDTKELEWYVDKSKPYYSEIVKILQRKVK